VIASYFPPAFHIPQLFTWTMRLERQIGKDWVLSAAYLGNKGTYLSIGMQDNPAIYTPGVDAKGQPLSTVANTQQRRVVPINGAVSRVDSGQQRIRCVATELGETVCEGLLRSR